MQAVVYSEPEKFTVSQVADPAPEKNQVLVKVARNGVCKTDLHIHHGRFISQFPLTPGHEFCGEIVAVGTDVTRVSVGQRVVCDNTVLCGDCDYCRRNKPLYCRNFVSLGCTTSGGLAEFVVVNADKVFPISDTFDFDAAALVEPTACVVHALDQLDVQVGDDVLIFGAGPSGIILAQGVKNCSANRVVVVAPSRFKLDVLNAVGIEETVEMDRNDYSRHATSLRRLAPNGFDIVIDATGHAPVLEHAFSYARPGAKILVYGACHEDARIPVSPYWIFKNEITIIGTFAQTHCFDRALKFIESGAIKVDGLITHRFPLQDYKSALDLLSGGGQSLKIMMHPNG